MRSIMRNNILGFILGLTISGGIGVVAYTVTADKIGFTPKDSSWKVNNVASAINDLKKNNNIEISYHLYSRNNTITIDNSGTYYLILSTRSTDSMSAAKNYVDIINGTCQYEKIKGYTDSFTSGSTYYLADYMYKIKSNGTCNIVRNGDGFAVVTAIKIK